jgi:hypothetical protein
MIDEREDLPPPAETWKPVGSGLGLFVVGLKQHSLPKPTPNRLSSRLSSGLIHCIKGLSINLSMYHQQRRS